MKSFFSLFFKELFWKIAKWTILKCPKSKIAKKFFQKKAKKTILLEDCRKFPRILKKIIPT